MERGAAVLTQTVRNELPCIWVLAGVLSYRLCDRNYECEGCELFYALRGEGRQPGGVTALPPAAAAAAEDPVSACVGRLISGCELHLDRAYSPGHFWIDSRTPDLASLGLDGHVWRVLHPVDNVVLPRVGAWLKRGGPCGWIERRQAVIPLTAPLAGEVRAVNDSFRAALRGWRPVGSGDEWLLRLEAHEAPDAVPGLFRGEQVLQWYLRQIQLLKSHLRGAVGPDRDGMLGLTLSDGGEPNPDLEMVLGREAFERLTDEMFSTPVSG